MRKARAKIISIVSAIALIICSIVGITLGSSSVQAAGKAETFTTDVMKKVLGQALKTCYKPSYMNPSVTTKEFTDSGFDSLMTSEGKNPRSKTILIPNKVGNTINDGNLSCLQVFKGYSQSGQSSPSVFSLYDVTISRNASGLVRLGYKAEASSGSSQGCLGFKYLTGGESVPIESSKICFTLDGSGDNATLTDDSYYAISPAVTYVNNRNSEFSVLYSEVNALTIFGPQGMSQKVETKPRMKWSDLKEDFESKAQSLIDFINRANDVNPYSTNYTYGGYSGSTSTNDIVSYSKPSSADVDLKSILGLRDDSSILFDVQDKAILYRTYIQNEIDAGNITMNIATCSGRKDDVKVDSGNAQTTKDFVYHRSNKQWCVVTVPSTMLTQKFNGWNANAGNPTMTSVNFEDILVWQAKDAYDGKLVAIADDESYVNGTAGSPSDAGGATDTTPPCFSSAESLGWIICPVIKGLSKALNGIYGYVESNFLMINSSLMANDGGLHTGWTQFRDIANIVFVILIVLVILSQVTGIGISNYGIKKVLPRLIAVAILANLSFIICQLAVDATNLLGVGLRQMFNSQSADLLSVTDFTTDLTTVLFSSAATTGVTAIAAVAAVHTWDLWLPAVLLFLFTTIISVLFFAVILGVRQAGIIILIALAPAAIVCYALPNTQKLFDRWFKLFTSLLLVFPICGILMGGGIYASNLMLAAANNAEEGAGFFFTLVAMLMQVVPFFLVPGLVKGSLALAGNIGTRISNFGSRLGTGPERGVRRSDGFQDMQERLRAQNAQRFLDREQWRQNHRFLGAPGRAADRIGSRIRSANNRFGKAAQDRYDRRRARAAGVYRKYQMDRIKAQAAPRGFTEVEGQRLLAAEKAKQLNEMTANDEFSIKSNQDFMSNISTQGETAYTAALDALRANPTDQNAIAHVRALQNVLSSTDPGREVIQNTLNRQLYDAQSSGNTGSIDQGLLKASNYLMEDHGGFKNENRGLYSMISDLQQGSATKVFANGGLFKDDGGAIRSHYDSEGTKKMTSSALANADEAALKRYVYAAQNNMMGNNDLTQLAATATDALTNRNIDVKPEYEKYLNDIRQAAYDRQKSSFTTDHAGNYFDDNGREFVHTTGDKYQYTDSSGTAHEYTRDAQGNFMSANGTDVVGADRITNAVQEFNIRNGSSHQDLRNNDRLDIPKRERRAPQKIQSDYYRSSVTGQWMNRSTGNPLTAQEIVRAEAYQRYNDNIDNHNTLNPTSGNP